MDPAPPEPALVGATATRFDRTPGRPYDELEQRGWTVVAGFVSPAECDALAGACDRRRWPDIPDELLAWITDPRWTAIAVPVLGPDVRFFRERVITKAPQSVVGVPWHQDNGYAGTAGEFLTCIVALEDLTVDNGCLWMLSGSHRGGVVEHVPTVGHWREIAAPIEDDGVPVEVARGSVIVLSSFTYHRSGPNRTDGTRRAWLVQFCRADAVDAGGRPLAGCPLVAEAGVWLERPRL